LGDRARLFGNLLLLKTVLAVYEPDRLERPRNAQALIWMRGWKILWETYRTFALADGKRLEVLHIQEENEDGQQRVALVAFLTPGRSSPRLIEHNLQILRNGLWRNRTDRVVVRWHTWAAADQTEKALQNLEDLGRSLIDSLMQVTRLSP